VASPLIRRFSPGSVPVRNIESESDTPVDELQYLFDQKIHAFGIQAGSRS